MHDINRHNYYNLKHPSAINKLLNAIASPLSKTPALFVALFLLDSLILCYFILTADSSVASLNAKIFSLINLFSRSFVFIWATLFIYAILRRFNSIRFLARIWLIVIFCLTAISAIIDIFLLQTQQDCFSTGYCDIILQTNFNEGSDFFMTYLSPKILMLTIGLTVFCIIISRLHFTIPKSKYIALPLLLISLIFCFRTEKFYGNADILSKILMTATIEPSVKLTMTDEAVVPSTNENPPQKIILIIGESYARSHCSLYGYHIQTTPHLATLQNDSLLYPFSSVNSPGLTTLESFKQLIGTWNPQKPTGKKWHECPTIPEVAHKADYRTYWLSNQSPTGLFDNQISNIAALADTAVYTTHQYNKNDITDYDGKLIPMLKEYTSNAGKEFFIVHLMGSHFRYGKRYPSEFKPFSQADYEQLPPDQREITFEYDSSIAYNDSIVTELFNLFQDKDAIGIYFPDHGEDIYESSPDYFGHGYASNPLSGEIGKRIPFMVYLTPQFKTLHPDLTDRIAGSTEKPFDTSDIIYTLMDVMSVRFAANNDVDSLSLFRNSR